MTMPFYVSPEQQLKDRADLARQGIGQATSVIVLQYEDGILFVAKNRSPSLHKVSEIYDRIGFAAAGRYNEFESLRQAGIRLADLQGYQFDRADVSARMLANRYAQALGTIFSSVTEKPYEVELVVAQVGDTADEDEVYRVAFHGGVGQERRYTVMGGAAEQISTFVERRYEPGLPLAQVLRIAVDALGQEGNGARSSDTGQLQLEVAMLDRTRARRRKFRRLSGPALDRMLAEGETPEAASDEGTSGQATSSEATPAEPVSDEDVDLELPDEPERSDGESGTDQPGDQTST